MVESLNINNFLKQAEKIPVIDVRTPAEFEHAHIPGAYNIPLFSNEERAQVGTTYKKQGKEQAVELGLKLVGSKLYDFVRQAKKIAKDKKLLVHCWRGGMRSASMAWLFQTAGLDVKTLEGGYKAYRRYVKRFFAQDFKLIVLGGMTGSGKTGILEAMQAMGEQVINIEKVARHKGSAFGALGEKKQPSTEQFENNLYESCKNINIEKEVWVEDESQAVGYVRIPEELYVQIRKAPIIKVNIPKNERIRYLLDEYGHFDKELLEKSILKIKKRLGGQQTQEAISALYEGNIAKAIEISLNYYDKAYNYGISKRNPDLIFEMNLKKIDVRENAHKILNHYNKLNLNTIQNKFIKSL